MEHHDAPEDVPVGRNTGRALSSKKIETVLESNTTKLQTTEGVTKRGHQGRSKPTWLRRNKTLLITLTVLVLLLMSSGIALGVYTWDRGLIYSGVSIAGVAVGNLDSEQARTKVEAKLDTLLTQTVNINVSGQTVKLSLSQLGLNFPVQGAIDQAYTIGREGNLAERALSIRKASEGINFTVTPRWDDKKLAETVTASMKPFDTAPTDASFSITKDNQMLIKPDKTGKAADTTALIAAIKAIDVHKLTALDVTFKTVQPKVTAAQLESQKITGLIATYSTNFDASQVNRSDNLRAAAAALDGTVVKPGEQFSFNKSVGPRTSEAGYKDAYVIVNGEFVPGLGGGICQVSSTLYNALLLANLSITERNNHTLAITYVPLGRDATVAYPSLDLKFRNDTGGYMVIRSKVSGHTISFYLYGKVKQGLQVDITAKVLSTLAPKEERRVDKSLPPGTIKVQQASHPGYVTQTYRTVKINGKVLKQENLGRSVYQPTDRIVLVGPSK